MKIIRMIVTIVAFSAGIMISTKVYAEDYVVPVTASGHTYTVTLHVDGKVTGVEATTGMMVGKIKLVVTPTLELVGSFAKQYPNALKKATLHEDEFRGIKFYEPSLTEVKIPYGVMIEDGIHLLPYVGTNEAHTWLVNSISVDFLNSPRLSSYDIKSVIFLADDKKFSLDIKKLGVGDLSESGKSLTYTMLNLDKNDLDQMRQIAKAKKVRVQVIFDDVALTSMVRTLSEGEKQYIAQTLAIYELLGGQ